MWPTGLIIGVTVASSAVILVSGIVLTMHIERQRHRSMLQHHIARLNALQHIASETSTYDLFQLSRPSSNWFRHVEPPHAGRTQVALPSQKDYWNSLRFSTSKISNNLASTEGSEAPDDQSYLLHGRSRKRCRLRRSAPLHMTVSSTLPSIAERSDPTSSPTSITKCPVTTTADCPDRNVFGPSIDEWPLVVSKTRRPDDGTIPRPDNLTALMRSNSTGHSIAMPQPARLSLSVGRRSTISLAPNASLPAVPLRSLRDQYSDYSEKKRVSIDSVETVSSSLLGVDGQNLGLERSPPTKTQSQALNAFDFDLCPTQMRLDSPARLTQRTFPDHRATINSFRASLDPSTTWKADQSDNHDIHSQLTRTIPKQRVTKQGEAGVTYRRSNTVQCKSGDRATLVKPPATSRVIDDPFVAETHPPPPGSAKHNLASRRPCIVQQRLPDPVNPVRNGHRRQIGTRISGIPIAITQQSRLPDSTSARDNTLQQKSDVNEKEIVSRDGTSGTPRSGESSPWPQPLVIKRSMARLQGAQAATGIPRITGPRTPQGYISPLWTIGSSPCSDNVSSPQNWLRDSPILPSPAYTSSSLRPRKSRIPRPQGPRSPLRAIANPLRMHSPWKQGRPRHASMSESEDSSPKMTAEKAIVEAPIVRDMCLSETKSVPASQQDKGSLAVMCTPEKSSTWTPANDDSMGSRSGTSVWEDASIHDGSPEVEMLTPTRRQLVDVGNEPRVSKEVRAGLGITATGGWPWNTPQSLYDEAGFLYE